MKLTDIVVEDAIITGLSAEDRDGALTSMLDGLVSAGAVPEGMRDEFLRSVIDRENRGSTGFGHGVAVPHVKHEAIEDMRVAVAVSPDGVDFNALDRKPVHSIFLLLSPAARPEEHLDAMEAIFGNLSQEQFRRFLRQATKTSDVMTLLEEADARGDAR